MTLFVLYPQPEDVEKFESDYEKHMVLLHEKTGIPKDQKPYTITRFQSGPGGNPPYFQMFSMCFDSAQALQDTMSSTGMQEVAADAHRISSGGAPVILIGD
jgi:uncharacterized protein (TIGR02118 family)